MRLGTRSSRLAQQQARFVAERLRKARPGVDCALVEISTHGDEDRDSPLPQIGGKGLFTEKIEQALRAGEIDAAVHSLKDLPVDDSPGLVIAAVLGREEVRDVLVSRQGGTLASLPPGSVVGTSSTRREAQLRALRPDLIVKPIRGNVETRIAKVRRGDYDATVMAGAGLVRLGLEDGASEWMDVETFLPAPGQGAMAVQCRADDAATRELLALIDEPVLRRATDAEREFLRCLGGGCAAPIAAFARVQDAVSTVLTLRGRVISMDGRRAISVSGEGDEARELARQLAEEARAAGAETILKPLSAKRVLVTRPRSQASDLVALLCGRGAVPVLLPLILVEPAGDASQAAGALASLSPSDWIVFTSANGVEHLLALCAGALPAVKVAAVGPATANALRAGGIEPTLVSSEHTGAALARALVEAEAGGISTRRFLMPCAEEHNEEAARVLRGAGAAVTELPVYRTVGREPGQDELAALDQGIDAVLLLSGSAARAFAPLWGKLSGAVVACLGPSAAESAGAAGIRVDVVPPEHTVQGIVNALEERFRR